MYKQWTKFVDYNELRTEKVSCNIDGLPSLYQSLKEWGARENGDGKGQICGADWNRRNSSWSHTSKSGGFARQVGDDEDTTWGNLPVMSHPGDVADDGWRMGDPPQEKQNLWDTNFFGQSQTRHHQPVIRFLAFAFA